MDILAHEYADLFPMMGATDYAALVEGMRKTGYDKTAPIVLYQDKVLDGRNRLKAALELGIDPPIIRYDGDDPLGFVIRHNLNRRHLNESQRAVVAGRLANLENGQAGNGRRSANLQTYTQPQAAAMLNVSPRTVATVKAIERAAPELVAKIESGEMTAHEASKEVKKRVRAEERAAIVATNAPKQSELYKLICADINSGLQEIESNSVDIIVTDPPYPEEYIKTYYALSLLAKRVLKPGGLCVVMVGQSYLPQLVGELSSHLTYHWTAAYLTPGAQSAQVWPRKVNPFWKPLLIYSKGEYTGKWFGDVVKSAVNDNDKSLHEWGQSESGMADILKRFTDDGPGVVLDPFCGAGTTGVVSIRNGKNFIGVDIDQEQIKIASGRLSKCLP